jgi:hypothetical protein
MSAKLACRKPFASEAVMQFKVFSYREDGELAPVLA